MSKHESEKRTSPQKSNPTTHYTPETPVTVGDHVEYAGTVVDCGHEGHGGCGGGRGGGGGGQGHIGPIDKQGHEQGGVHQGLGVVYDESYTSRELAPAPPLGYLTVTREEWTILSNKAHWFEEMAKKQAITIKQLETKLNESPYKRGKCMKDQFFIPLRRI